MDWLKGHSINEWIFPKTKSFTKKCESWIKFVKLCKKSDLKIQTGVHTSDFAKKTDLVNLKSDADKLDIDKLKNLPSGLNSLKSSR